MKLVKVISNDVETKYVNPDHVLGIYVNGTGVFLRMSDETYIKFPPGHDADRFLYHLGDRFSQLAWELRPLLYKNGIPNLFSPKLAVMHHL